MQANMGMAGEFRCVVKRADGSTKIDTGYQKNLILNQGLDFFGGFLTGTSSTKTSLMSYCVIGGGNSTPVPTQNKLDAIIEGVYGNPIGKGTYSYTDGSQYHKVSREHKYSFTTLSNVNVAEVGLALDYSSLTNYKLVTRALIKDSNGNPTTITVLPGEILDIYYKIWAVFNTADMTGTINVLDGAGGITLYNYTARLSSVGSGHSFYGMDHFNQAYKAIGTPLQDWYGDSNPSTTNHSITLYNGVISDIKNLPTSTVIGSLPYFTFSPYTLGSFKRGASANFPVSAANGDVRSILLRSSMGWWQIRFGSVANDSPITKTNTQTLSIPIEFSWGRYEGAL